MKQHKWSRILVLSVLCGALNASALLPPDAETLEVYSQAAEMVARTLPRAHLSGQSLDDVIAHRALDIFLRTLDFERVFFLADDVRRFQEQAGELDNRLRQGEIDFAFEVYDVLMTRVSNRVAYVETLLEGDLDFAQPEVYVWDRKEAPWPADEAAWDELWRLRVKNQLLARRVQRTLAEEQAAAEAPPDTPQPDAPAEEPAGEPVDDAAAGAADETGPPSALAALLRLSPEDWVRKESVQLLHVLNDNDADWLLTLYISSFAQAYDPHTSYLSQRNKEDFDINMRLSLVGIGAVLSTDEGLPKIMRLIPGGPAERDGRLQPGDKIVAVAQDNEEAVDILHWPLSRAVRLIRGEKDTRVVLTVIPATDVSGSTLREIDLVRDEVQLEEQAAKGRLERQAGPDDEELTLGIITVPEFYADVAGLGRGTPDARSVSGDVRRILAEFAAEGVDGVVLDLRGNSGGLLSEAVELAGLFIEHGPVVLVRSGGGLQVLRDPDPAIVYAGPLVVLQNRLSASAAEIVAAALKDYGRAVVVGDLKSHGKGTVQGLHPLHRRRPELGELKSTGAAFYRISGGSTQLEGVRPHIEIPTVLDQLEVGEEYLPHALPWSTVRATYYERARFPEDVVPELRARSESRREENERFQQYLALVNDIGRRRQSKTLPLNFDERLAIARQEKSMSAFVRRQALDEVELVEPEEAAAAEDEADVLQADLMLQETMHILADLVGLSRAVEPVADAAAAQARSAGARPW
ncbi:MAG: carboxy terminal-processing peptidase [Candidatus Marinimicrobia bacterium]|nr:carboxy terminal-processing peptidase [Candidatus Neomarinimicrobiota bacterium]